MLSSSFDLPQARHQDAVSHLDVAWSWDQIPAPWDAAGQAVWLRAGGQRPSNPAAQAQWLRKAQKEMSK
jgi:hypothetical protein